MKKTVQFALLLIFSTSLVYAQKDSAIILRGMAEQLVKPLPVKPLEEIVVPGITATSRLPVTFTNINSKEIRFRYYGADIPTLINRTPSVNAYSDNGTGIGYSYFRLRGIDQTRINTTVNGIPVNDPENQGVYFNNFADLATSTENIQVQRGVGTSTNGTSAFGGSINMILASPTDNPGAKIYTGVGSFGSSRMAVEVNTGRLNNHFMFSGRYSELKTNGFRRNSGADIQSYLFSAAYVRERTVWRLNVFGGRAKNQLSYTGIDRSTFDADNKTNNFVNGESDAFKQQFYQLQYSHKLDSRQAISASVYYVRGQAPMFQFLFPGSWGYSFSYFNMPNAVVGSDTISTAQDMMTSYRLDQRFAGGFITYQYQTYKIDFTAGLHANSFSSDHFMEVNWGGLMPAGIAQNHQVYFNTGFKKEASAFVKINYHLSERLSVFADLQLRTSSFTYQGRNLAIRQDPFIVDPMSWLFVNPKLGARMQLTPSQSVYAMAGVSSREPTRFDYFQDDFATKNTRQNEIKPEQVLDLEAGHQLNWGKLWSRINVYSMEFKNQIVGSGQLNNYGYPVTTNVGRSFRRGIELDMILRVGGQLQVLYSGSFSKSGIKEFTQHFGIDSMGTTTGDTGVVYRQTALGYSPAMIHNLGLRYFANGWLNAELMFRHVSMQYLDNTQNKDLSVPAFNVTDFKISIILAKWIATGQPVLDVQLNNIGDVKYAPTGSLGGYNTISGTGARGNSPLYFPAAGRNIFVTLKWTF